MRVFRIIVVAASTALAVEACGGGGDAAPGPGPGPGPAQLVITAANQNQVAAAALRAVTGSAGLTTALPLQGPRAQTLTSMRIGPTPIAGSGTAWRSVAIDLALRTVSPGGSKTQASATGRMRALAVTTETVACAVSGSYTVVEDDLGTPNEPVGDTVRITFNDCKETADALMSGSLDLAVTAFSAASPSSVQLSAAVSAQGLSESGGGYTSTTTGNLALSLGITTAADGSVTVAGTLSVPGGSLATTTIGPNGFNETVALLPGLTVSVTESVNASGASVVSTLRLDGPISAVGGTLVLQTTTPFSALAGDAYPRQGAMVISGGSNSRLVVTALSSATVRLQRDDTGDGTFEASSDIAWVTLVP